MNSVHIDVKEFILNNKVTSREDILKNAREIIARDGIESLSIRSLAKECKIATGSMYNYFSSKDEMILATVTSVWQELFNFRELRKLSFYEAIEELISSIEKGREHYPHFFKLHSLMFNDNSKTGGKKNMDELIVRIKLTLIEIIDNDSEINKEELSKTFTKEAYVDLIFNIILSLFVKEIDKEVILKVVKKTIY